MMKADSFKINSDTPVNQRKLSYMETFYREHTDNKKLKIKKVISPCQITGCTTRASYNYEYDQRPARCYKHVEKRMINVNTRKCGVVSCNGIASYNYIWSIKPARCSRHIRKYMMNVVAKLCEDTYCINIATHNFEYEPPRYCELHSLPNMQNTKNRMCAYPSCNNYPTFNYDDEIHRKYCYDHKEIAHKYYG